MRHSHSLLLLAPLLAAASPLAEVVVDRSPKPAPPVSNANHIFNAIHSSMRQFGSSLNHNGMSLFVATVPAGTTLYHGTHTSDRVNGTEWLAFEPEHAMLFARPRGGPPGRDRPGHGPPGRGPPRHEGPYIHEDLQGHGGPSIQDDSPKHGRPPGERPAHCGRPGQPVSDDDKSDNEHDRPWWNPFHRPQSSELRPHKGHGPPMRPHDMSDDRHSADDSSHPEEQNGHHKPPGPPPPGPPPSGSRPPPPGPPPSGSRPPPPGPPPPGPPPPGRGPPPSSRPPPSGWWVRRLGDAFRNPKRRHASPGPHKDERDSANSGVLLEQEPLPSEHVNAQAPGYFHTYKTKHDLRLLYVDGQSAAKSDKGTLDVQDVVIINSNSSREHEPMFGEKQRADDMCKIAREEWSGRIDGILRMEGGFEIILCDFAAHLDVVEIAEFAPPESDGGRPMSFDYYRAVAARYDSIGGGRVALDYDHFVTVFSHADAIYFDETGRPRVQNGSVEVSHVRQEITDMVLHASNTSKSTDWQAVVDMIVTRYADRLEYLTSGAPRTIDQLKTELDRALRPFINYGSRNGSLEVERCAKQFLPTKADADTIAARAVADVSHTLCSSLAAAAADDKYETALSRIIDLKTYLSWTTWKRCKGCGMHEICFLPIWPVGSAEDFEQPKCRSNVSTGPGDNGRYWRR